MELIRKDELLKRIQNVVILPARCFGKSYTAEILNNIIKAIETAPSVDAVPVVRCKDCKHRNESKGCSLHSDDYFCAFGEKKNGEQHDN